MNRYLIFILSVVLCFTGCKKASTGTDENIYPVIPAPLSLTEATGKFEFSRKTEIVVSGLDRETSIAADMLARLVEINTGLDIQVKEGTKAGRGSVLMLIDTLVTNAEGYTLTVTPRRITIKARSAAGLFYAVQTLRQLMPAWVETEQGEANLTVAIPACEISDEPRYSYRGMHLDVGRHLFPVSEIKKYIDMLALHKMNRFHWHLTEDQGWRIEIKKYPRLTEVGAFRKETVVGHTRRRPMVFDGERYGGYYTQDEIKEVVAYAAERFITVIPEIEMPGHSLAALAAYPDLSCTGGPFEVGTRWGIFDDIYCAGKEETFTFLEDVLSEVIDLFPSEYIHIGGDESPKARWQRCALCQRRITDEGLDGEDELQSYFIRRIEKFLISKNRRLIGWDEILEGGLAPEATVMSWRGVAGGIEAAKQGHDVIMSPSTYVYLDYYQSEPEGQPLAIGGYLPLEKVYSFDPLFEELSPEENKHILGLQGNVWTEYISDPEYLDYMAFPRAFAIAETGWTATSKKDFEDFLARFEIQRKRYDLLGLDYFKGEYRDTRARNN